jgi:hypothetical protein
MSKLSKLDFPATFPLPDEVIWGHLPTFTTDIQWGPLEILHVFSMALV